MEDAPSADSLESWVRLARAPGIGPALAHALLQRFANPGRVLDATRSELAAAPGMGDGRIDVLLAPSLREAARREIDRAIHLGIRMHCLEDSDYPALLRALPHPPLVISALGALKPQDRLGLTVVGPRMPSDYARRMTRRLVPPLAARGLTVISGLAQGIDAEAHAAALGTGGRTLAVLGQGLDTPFYPASNRDLAYRIVREERGAILSVFPLSAKPQPALYPQRNEVLAALGLGVLVVEAGTRSGALITARHALDFGRTVMACPGDADRPLAQGSNQLLSEGGALIQNSDDVLEVLAGEIRLGMEALGEAHPPADDGDRPRPEGEASTAPTPPVVAAGRGDPLDVQIRRLLSGEHRPLDYILEGCARAGFSHGAVVQRLLELEMGGELRQFPGRVYGRLS